MIITLDGRKFTGREAAHDYLGQIPGFPEYYGKNLDALYDVLTSYREQVCFRVEYSGEIIEKLGTYGEKLLKVFADADRENRSFTFEVVD